LNYFLEVVAMSLGFIFAEEASQYHHYVTILNNSPGSFHVAELEMVVTQLMLIFMMRQ